jgi:hypothetical protein
MIQKKLQKFWGRGRGGETNLRMYGGGEELGNGISMWEMGYLEIRKNLKIAKNRRMLYFFTLTVIIYLI